MYIGQIKTKYGLDKRKNFNISKKEKYKPPTCPIEKERYIVEALKYYKMLDEDEMSGGYRMNGFDKQMEMVLYHSGEEDF